MKIPQLALLTLLSSLIFLTSCGGNVAEQKPQAEAPTESLTAPYSRGPTAPPHIREPTNPPPE